MKRNSVMAALDVMNPLRNATADHVRWGGGHTHSLLLLGAVGLATLGPIGYIFYRDWRLHRAFRRYWERSGSKGQTPTTVAEPVTRKPLIVQNTVKPQGPRPVPTANDGPKCVFSGPASAIKCNAPQPTTPVPPASGNEAGSVSPTTALTGVLEIEGRPGEGEIYVDGAFFGNTPGRLVLVPGKHVVEIRTPGSTTSRREVFVAAGETLTLKEGSGPQPSLAD